jgi:hypothetical protein
MAETRGLVQRFKTDFRNVFWIYIGPSPTNTQLFSLTVIVDDRPPYELAIWAVSAVALIGAQLARREVIVFHDEGQSEINFVQLEPG